MATYSPQDIADRHGLCRAMVYRLIQRGELQAVKIGRLTRITAEQEAAWLASLPRVGGVREAIDQ